MTGYIKLHRKIINWAWYKDLKTKSVFVHLLLKASFEDKLSKTTHLNRGEVLISEQDLAYETGLSRQNVRTVLKNLEKGGEIERKKSKNHPIITIKNYNNYQGLSQDDKPKPTKRSAQKATNIYIDKEIKKKEEINLNNLKFN
ncbi:MAG: hypothetical protein BWY78_00510 [Alphaproteobacteria bacterium ADurb.Bin438]|nr:MAG: hypothetical protein BWY78_00510 [Alphaproteobacteria bacterium ADurb.Bin438]